MDKLWSPWRSKYIESFKSKTGNEECAFCEAQNKDIDSDDCIVVYKGKTCYITLNLYPYNSGHLMVVPYRHISDFLELTEEETKESMELIRFSMKALTDIMKPHGFNMGLNVGKAAGAGIHEHLHFHLLPRWPGDTNFMPALGDVKVISQDLLVTKKNLIDAFSKILKEE